MADAVCLSGWMNSGSWPISSVGRLTTIVVDPADDSALPEAMLSKVGSGWKNTRGETKTRQFNYLKKN